MMKHEGFKDLKDINATLVTGAFSSPVKERLRPAIDTNTKDFQLKTYLNFQVKNPSSDWIILNLPTKGR